MKVSMPYKSIEFGSKADFEAMDFSIDQIDQLHWVTYKVDDKHTFLVKSHHGYQPGIYETWELE